MTDKEAAKKILELLGPNGEHWTTKRFARNENDEGVEDERSPEAVKWCLLGAAHKLGIGVQFLYDKLVAMGEVSGVVRFNDNKESFAPVKDFLQKIAKGEL